MVAKPGRSGAVRKKSRGKTIGTGGQGRQALEGKGPTPKAEDRTYHAAYRKKQLAERSAAKRGGASANSGQRAKANKPKRDEELVNGRNSVLEALRTKIPATTVYIAQRVEMDDRIREILATANHRDIPIVEITRAELDRICGFGEVHQGIALKVKAYEYSHPDDLLQRAADGPALLVALDGVTDPRNLGAIIRSVAAFGGHGVIVPARRSVGVTPAAWKTSAGAAARIPVAQVTNLTQALKKLKQQGVFVLGLDGGGDVRLPGLSLSNQNLVLVVGSEGKGLSRLVTETCDLVVSIPISAATESLNAGIATSVALYEIAKLRAE